MKKLIIMVLLTLVILTALGTVSVLALENPGRLPEFEEEVQNILSCIDPAMSDVEKALAVHEYFIMNYNYGRRTNDFEVDPSDAYTAYGIMVNKFGVCEAYTQAYKYIMEQLGIPCIIVTSTAMNHAWNMINVDGDWYHVDVTWDDSNNTHRNFLLSDKGIAATGHYAWDGNTAATSTKYDDAFWTNVESYLHYIDKHWYYVDRGIINSRYQDGFTINDYSKISDVGLITKYSFETDTHETVFSVKPQNYTYKDDGNSYKTKWKGGYTSIASYNDRLYYNTNNKIFSINTYGKDEKLVCTVTPPEFPLSDTVGKAYIVNMEIINGTIYYKSSEISDTFIAAELPSAAPSYTIATWAGRGGKILPSGNIRILKNKSRTFKITPESGLKITDVVIDGKSMGPLSEYTFRDITSDHTIQATFAAADGEWQLTMLDLDYDYESSIEVYSFSESLAAVRNLELDKTGFIDTSGKLVIPFNNNYESMSSFNNGVSAVCSNGKYGLINTSGEVVLPCIYNTIVAFSEGIAIVEKDGKFGFIDSTGKQIAPCIYENIRDFKNGVAWVYKAGEGFFIDTSGNVVSGYVDEDDFFSKDVLNPLYRDGKWGYSDSKGEVVVPYIYEQVGDFHEGMAYVSQNGKYGFVNTAGKLVIPTIYDEVGKFSEGMAYVSQNGKFGYMNKTGDLVVPCIYRYVGEFREGLAYVLPTEEYGPYKYGYINTAGEVVVPYIFDTARVFSEGIAPVVIDGRWAILKITTGKN